MKQPHSTAPTTSGRGRETGPVSTSVRCTNTSWSTPTAPFCRCLLLGTTKKAAPQVSLREAPATSAPPLEWESRRGVQQRALT